jgi:hypothetical protein cdivTM_18087
MSDHIVLRRGRNVLSSILHVALNIALAVGSVLITWATKSPVIGLSLVLISKWRTFAVRPHYLELNIKANLVDLIVGCSFVLIAYCSGPVFLPIHLILMVLYSFWLIFLKPRSSELSANLQSLWAIFFGTTALVLISANANAIFMALGGLFIGYSAVRHVLVQGDDKDYGIIIMASAIISAELAWLAHSWLIVYSFDSLGVIIPQLSVVMTIVAAFFSRISKSLKQNDGQLNWSEISMPTIFATLTLILILVWFSQPVFNI